MGLFFFSSGHFVLSFATNVVCGVVADLIALASGYKKKSMLLVSYIVFSYGLTGPVLPMWFMKDNYVQSLIERGKDQAYIDGVFEYISMGTFGICVVSILVCAVIGGIFGQKMIKKHFAKAGIV